MSKPHGIQNQSTLPILIFSFKCGYPERFAQQALGHNSKAVHHAYAKHAEVTVPSLDDWEQAWQKNPQSLGQPELLPVNFQQLAVQATAQ